MSKIRKDLEEQINLQQQYFCMHQHCKHGQFLQFPHPSSQRILGFQQLPGPKTKSTFKQDGRSILYKVWTHHKVDLLK